MKTLLLLSRPGCSLCESVEDQLHEQFGNAFRLDWRDVDREPEWRAAYGDRIPVLLSDQGAELSVGSLDAVRVGAYLGNPAGSV